MTAAEIRANVPPMAIWMADAIIRKARVAITGNTGWSDVKRAPYNLPEVEVAGAVLFRMFNSCEFDIKMTLLDMPEEMDGIGHRASENYFDTFVELLDRRVRDFHARCPQCATNDPDWPKEAEPRKSYWILEKC